MGIVSGAPGHIRLSNVFNRKYKLMYLKYRKDTRSSPSKKVKEPRGSMKYGVLTNKESTRSEMKRFRMWTFR